VIIGAKFVIPRAGELVTDGAVCIVDGKVQDVGKKDELIKAHPLMPRTDLENALITPGLINFHCHLELEFCKGKVTYNGNFIDWLQRIRDLKHDYLMLPGYFPENGVKESLSSGVTTMVDHYTMHLNFQAINECGLRYLGLRELFDFNNHNPDEARLRDSTVYSFAIHSPYTTSAEVAQAATKIALELGRPISTHLSEMQQEIEFILKSNEDVEKLLKRAGAHDENWKPPGVSPIRYFSDLGILTPRTYCVHLNYYLPGDIEILKNSGITHIYCPRSHSYFRHPTHPLMEYQKAGITTCLGTDSYGSNADLRILGEAKKVWEEFPELSAKRVFEMFTTAGLKPLAMEGLLGELRKGAFGDLAAWQNPQGETFDELVAWLVNQETAMLTMREGKVVHEI